MQTSVDTKNGSRAESLYRRVPSVHDLLLGPEFGQILLSHPRQAVVEATRQQLAAIRQRVGAGQLAEGTLAAALDGVAAAVAVSLEQRSAYSLRPVINATGVLLHTNLGRAPLSQSALDHLVDVASGYCNLEMDLATGDRSRRDVHAESLLLAALRMRAGVGAGQGSEQAVVVVNNCAAATLLALDALARDREVVVSRGELVEIGGGFRIPEILARSGARLREVGTTNRTRVADYSAAINPATGLILRVHQSNFSIEGFTERPALEPLLALGRRTGVAVFEDQGTGLIGALPEQSAQGEESLVGSFRLGTDLIAASGDKLLGGPQCGLLIGRRDLIERIRSNPLLRALRVDKLIYAALEATLIDYIGGRESSLPLFRMLHMPAALLQERSLRLAARIASPTLAAEVVAAESIIGGGTAPRATLEGYAVALSHASVSCATLLRAMRQLPTPVIGRISGERIWLDLRTVEPSFDDRLAALLLELDEAVAGGERG